MQGSWSHVSKPLEGLVSKVVCLRPPEGYVAMVTSAQLQCKAAGLHRGAVVIRRLVHCLDSPPGSVMSPREEDIPAFSI